jgi:hypothetical protein
MINSFSYDAVYPANEMSLLSFDNSKSDFVDTAYFEPHYLKKIFF